MQMIKLLAVLLVSCLAGFGQVTVSPGSPTLNPSNVTINYTSPQADHVKLVIGRTAAAPCVIGLQGTLIKLFPTVSAWAQTANGYIGSGTISNSACTINLAASTHSTTSGWSTLVTTTLNIQVSGALSQADMDVAYLYSGYDESGSLNQYERIDAVGTWNVTNAPAQPGILTFPTPTTVLQSSGATLVWSPANFPANYEVLIGTTQGAGDIISAGLTSQTQYVATNLPLGSTIHVTLRTHPIGGGSALVRYYTVLTQSLATAAQITSPAPNSTLSSSAVTFQWTPGQGATLYRLLVGTSAGNADILDQFTTGLSLSAAIPSTGLQVHVTLIAHSAYSSQSRSFTYRAASPATPPRPAGILSPAPGTILPQGNVTFSWEPGVAVQSYRLAVGTVPEGSNLYLANLSSTSAVVTTIPQTGVAVHVTLWSQMGSTLSKNSYVYLAPTTTTPTIPAPQPATIISPVSGSVLVDSSATFQWSTSQGADSYQLCVGTAPSGCNIYLGSQTWSNSQTAFGLPTNGVGLHVTLWSRISGVWYSTAISVLARSAPPPPSGPAWAAPVSPSLLTFREFRDGYWAIDPDYSDWGPTPGANPVPPFGMFVNPVGALPKVLITPRGRRYTTAFTSPTQSGEPPWVPGAAAAGGAECYPTINPQGQVCASLASAAQRDPQQAIRTPEMPTKGFRVVASFRDPGTPLRYLENPRSLPNITTQPLVVPDLFNAFQSIFFHQKPDYNGGYEYGFQYDARSGNFGVYAAADANLVSNRGIGFKLDALVDGLEARVLSETLVFSSWISNNAQQERCLCFQVAAQVSNTLPPTPLMSAWCANAQQILARSSPPENGGFLNVSDVEAFLTAVDTAPGYVTANNIYFTQGIKAFGLEPGQSPFTPYPLLRYYPGSKLYWREYWGTAYDISESFSLTLKQVAGTQ